MSVCADQVEPDHHTTIAQIFLRITSGELRIFCASVGVPTRARYAAAWSLPPTQPSGESSNLSSNRTPTSSDRMFAMFVWRLVNGCGDCESEQRRRVYIFST